MQIKCRLFLWTFSFLFTSIGFTWMTSSKIHSAILKRVLSLEQDRALFELWKGQPHTMYRKIYFFNVTNSEEFLSGSKMIVHEVGPLTYTLERHKTDFHWLEEGNMTYKRIERLRFVPEMSSVSEKALIYILNATTIENFDPAYRQKSIESKFLIMKTSIWELMHGTEVEHRGFSWLNQMSCSKGSLYNIHTGKKTNKYLNFVKKWNGRQLRDLEGNVSIARRSSVELGPSTEDVNGLENLRFEISSHINGFSDLDDNLDANCRTSTIDYCCPSYPVLISLPHFFSVKFPIVWVSGLNPNKTIHNSFVDVEPVTGLTTMFSIRYQFNVKLKANKYWDRVRTGVYPVFWVDDSGNCSRESDNFLLYYVRIPYFIMHNKVSWLIFFIFSAFVFSNIILFCFGEEIVLEKEEGIPILRGAALRHFLTVNYKELNSSFEEIVIVEE
ncbi:lysosome membrane protein 2 [Trichonephila inaurata madagascariensis]|uniref:Scavenger receptor class B member 1 n=1 Tax=Trichonephila inaurata madagascariensis TaxID=2747483 RepID=A0A8X7CPT3_9ARAC|nr:lysosome membrane protein 2 [Trichonephila inaurata madagascariensis]